MKVPYKGNQVELTTELIMEVGGIGRKAARNRINAFKNKKITIEQLLFKGSYTNHAVAITKNGVTFTAPELARQVEGLTVTAANKRLQAWKAGRITLASLKKPVPKRESVTRHGTKEWQLLQDVDRVNPKDIKITPFEREYGREREIAWGYKDA